MAAGSIICRGSANSSAVGSEIARIWPLRSVIIARWASEIGIQVCCGAASSCGDRMLRPVRLQRLDDGCVGKLEDDGEEQHQEAGRREHQPRARHFQRGAPLQVGRGDAHVLHARHGVGLGARRAGG